MRSIIADFHGRQGAFTLDVAFTLPAGGCTGIFGPSGCGKTTILRCLAGLTRFPGSTLSVDGEVWQDDACFLPTYRRPIGCVFQEPRLFSHLSVRENLRYGLKRVKAPHKQDDFERVCALMGIEPLLDRSTWGLSGGEQQRIAIARALLTHPRLLLMDEPLSALDRDSRREILPYLETLHTALQLPILYVTHDFSEIERLADHLLLLEAGGRLRASGPLTDLVTDLSLPIAREPEAASVLPITVKAYDEPYDLTLCALDGIQLAVPGKWGKLGQAGRLRVSASDVSLVKGPRPSGSTLLNILPARILEATEIGRSQIMVLLQLEATGKEVRLLASVTRKSWDTLDFKPGDAVFAQVKSMALADAR